MDEAGFLNHFAFFGVAIMNIDGLYVFPEYRHRGFGSALQMHYIVKTMENGYVPFGQVEKGNRNSLKQQQKIGMTRSDNLIVWMWR